MMNKLTHIIITQTKHSHLQHELISFLTLRNHKDCFKFYTFIIIHAVYQHSLETVMTQSHLPFSAHYLIDEETWVNQLLDYANPGASKRQQIKQLANKLVENVRAKIDDMDGVDAFMKEYDLSSKEGILLMCLAEALLRIPDKDTADKLIKDKILEADWKSHLGKSDSMFVNASTWGLMLTGKIIDVDENQGGMKRAMDKFINKTGYASQSEPT